jgi:hypothetical protein
MAIERQLMLILIISAFAATAFSQAIDGRQLNIFSHFRFFDSA